MLFDVKMGITLAIGIVSIVVTLILSQKTRVNQERIRKLIPQITGLFSASEKVGIVTAYENREKALASESNLSLSGNESGSSGRSFLWHLENEKKLIVIGSSLLGLKMYVPCLSEILAARVAAGFENKFMMTHPCFSGLRESQERRKKGQIQNEVENMTDILDGCGLNLNESLRFYRGTPTCFVIITSKAMLVNPYPYQIEAFKSFCLEVRKLPATLIDIAKRKKDAIPVPAQIAPQHKSDFNELMKNNEEKDYDYRLNVGPDIYGQFYWYHYILPWFSGEAVTFENYCNICCQKCNCLSTGFEEKKCKLNKEINPKAKSKEPIPNKYYKVT
jgi:hypothetical protein